MDSLSPPPPYRRHSRHGQVPHSGSELSRYTRRNTLVHPIIPREPTQHVFPLAVGRSKPWLVLRLSSNAKSAKSLPLFYEKENINATLELHAEKGDSSIQSVIAMVRGRIITGPRPEDTVTFLDIRQNLWARSADAPRTPSPSEGTSGSKLYGDCIWSFSIPIPRSGTVGKSGTQSRLPETFSERDLDVNIQYDLTVHVSRGKFRGDSQIRTPFGYVPSSKPEAPSILRQLAYQQALPVPGPAADPRGWKTLSACRARGTICTAEVQCSFSLARPLCYTRGSIIPCFLTLSSRDPQALDMITASDCINVKLQRRVMYSCAPGLEKRKVATQECFREFSKAAWWPSSTMPSDLYNRHLEGEIRIPKDLRPSSLMDHFSVSYCVVLHPFNLPSNRSTTDSEILLSEPVDVVTTHARGPRPVAYSPPAYDPYSRENDDY
ncbi:hypothetical protein D9757_002500 [Collybiopsis confluens]|uniref:Arrestin-like N-terminal domain-containing protein n=1 Tax=Collybiopsis confluens TaxID=2823264 RepID=A0A8H5MF36_9AGAR|nr:hypothetical protein D9757_002500 [Collybiopsis confluens]